MKLFKRLISLFLIAALLLPTLGSGAVLAGETKQKSISNDFMTFSVNEETGFFNIGTMNGHPQKSNDNNIDLIYSGDSIETSFVTVRVDGTDYIFGQDYGIFGINAKPGETTVDAVNNSVSTVWTIDGIKVTQTAFLSRTDNTMRTGNVSLSYKVENTTGKSHNVGIRVMLDNSLGDVDAPVTMAESELAPIMKETEFFSNGKDPGDYIRHLDSYDTPTRETFFMFDPLLTHKPDSMIVGHWYNLASTTWTYSPDGNMSYASGINDYKIADTATALYWNEQPVEAGSSYERTLLYGVGDFSLTRTEGNFNVTLEIDDSGLTLDDKGKYTDNTVDARVTIHNNVDGSVDLDAPSLNLSCDDGAFFVHRETDGELVGFQNITEFPGYIEAGSIRTMEFEIAVDVPDELKTISVIASLTGNSTDNVSSAKQYILARAPKAETSVFSVSEISQKKYHKSGNRVMALKGSFSMNLLSDTTKWAVAFVNKLDSSVRYEVHARDVLVTSDEDMTLIYAGDMITGQYDIEFKFFDDYRVVFGDKYLYSSIEIVDDESLIMSDSSIAAVVRRGTGMESKYEIQIFPSAEAMKTAQGKLAPTDEMVLVLNGEFDIDTDSSGKIKGLTSLGNMTVNEVIGARRGTRLEYFSTELNIGGKASGVRLTGTDGAHTSNLTNALFDSDWKIEFKDGALSTLAAVSPDNEILIEPTGFTASLLKIPLGHINLRLGILGKGSAGYTVSGSGTISILGYDPLYDESVLEKSILQRSGKGFNLTCDIKDVMFDKDGFVGINTTIRGAWTSTNIIGAAQYDKWNFQLDIDTIGKEHDGTYESYGFSAQVTIKKKLTVTAGGRLREVEFDNGESMVLPDSFKLNFAVVPTSAIPFVPAVFEMYMLGIDISGVLDLVDDYSQANTPEERRLMANQATTNIAISAGFVLFEVFLLNATGSVGTNHVNIALNGICLLVPGATITGVLKNNWKVAIHDHNGNVISPTQYTLVLSVDKNFIDIFKGGGSFSYSYVDKGDGAEFLDENTFIINLYGGLYIPKIIPIVGGLEVFGATGTFSTAGISVVGTILGNDIGFSYVYGEEVQWQLFAAGDSAPELNTNNMHRLSVKSPGMRLMSAQGNYVSGIISGSDDYTGLMCVNYIGNAPKVSDLEFSIDGTPYPLILSDDNYQNGNCFVVPDTGEGGKILIGVANMPSGDHTYTLNAPEGVRLVSLEALGFTKLAKPVSVKGNGNGTATVTADRSLLGSTVELYYLSDRDAYENIRTEEYTDENGEIKVKVYKETDGKKVELGEEFYRIFAEHKLGSEKVTTNKTSVTFTPEITPDVKSGDYYLMALVRSPYGKLSRVLSDEAIHYVNTHQPNSVKSSKLTDAGNGRLKLEIEDADNVNYTGYFVSLYNETDKKYEFENQYASTDDDIIIENHIVTPGKKYYTEVTSVNVYAEDAFSECAETVKSESATVRNPEKLAVTLSLKEKTANAEFKDTDGETYVYPCVSSPNVTLLASSDKSAKGRFTVDSAVGEWTPEFHTDFARYVASLAPGKHTVMFEAMNSLGDITASNAFTFVVSAGAPSVLLEEGTVGIENGKITVRGNAFSSQKIRFMDKYYPVAEDGSFEIVQSLTTERYVESYPLTAIGFDGSESAVNVVVLNPLVKPIDSIVLKSNGVDCDEIILAPGETAVLEAFGCAQGEERDMDGEIEISVSEGNSLVTLNSSGVLTAHATGTAYVRASYNLGSRIDGDKARQYAFDDVVKVRVLPRAVASVPSIPDGATVEYGEKLELEGDGEIYYTLDGTTPTTNSKHYTGPISLPEGRVTVKAIVVKEGFSASDVITLTYNVRKESGKGSGVSGGTRPTVVIEGGNTSGDTGILAPGSHTVNYGYRLTIPAGRGVVYYTTDGTTPNKNSNLYTEPIRITRNTKIRAVVWTEGDYYSAVYEYDLKLNAHNIYFKDGVEKSALINGYPDATFRPDNAITRAETAAILRRASEMYGYHIDSNRFPDVEMWAKGVINELAAADVVTGYPDGTFRPDNTVTRAEFVAMLMRINGNAGATAAFDDTHNHWAERYIAKASEYGYINGYSDGTFRPDNPITRAEVIAIISRLFLYSSGSHTGFKDVPSDHWAFGYIAN